MQNIVKEHALLTTQGDRWADEDTFNKLLTNKKPIHIFADDTLITKAKHTLAKATQTLHRNLSSSRLKGLRKIRTGAQIPLSTHSILFKSNIPSSKHNKTMIFKNEANLASHMLARDWTGKVKSKVREAPVFSNSILRSYMTCKGPHSKSPTSFLIYGDSIKPFRNITPMRIRYPKHKEVKFTNSLIERLRSYSPILKRKEELEYINLKDLIRPEIKIKRKHKYMIKIINNTPKNTSIKPMLHFSIKVTLFLILNRKESHFILSFRIKM